ncbi:hypothetical protein F4827_000739 [Paraburkholderia bannensis]|uniref:Uncharacterized protein n=1 Tax=Paraburkholderia bannensis TaxID=765414 RepID=A0A7W9TT08_9BURK|nr:MULTISPECIES: hypothetical protein [Paraburkholderia]MBB3255913.1 hypothetical protein [Paraburkholderia sp. WP4_3_2]MBB6100913.1 hypothetical protein [Paraburkholderia bannensis]
MNASCNYGHGRMRLSKKIWAGVPGSDANGYSDPADTIQYAFGVVPAGTQYADLADAQGAVDSSKLIGGVLMVVGASTVELQLAPGSYWLYEFVIERDTDGVSVRFSQRGGWDFSALVDGERRTPPEGADGAITFEIGDQTSVVNVVGINKSLCVQIDKRLSSSAGAGSKKDILFFGTSSYLGLTPDKFNWNGPAIVRLGLTNADGELRLDGFVSGCNVFIHEVVPKALYDAGVRPGKMSVYRLDGSLWYDTDLPEAHEITQAEIDQLLADPKYTEAGHALIRGHLHVGDWIFATSSYFYDRQGVMRVEITNDNHRKGRLCLSKKIWAGVPGSDANGYSDPADTIQYAFGVVPAGTQYADLADAQGVVDSSKLIGGVLMVVGASTVELQLAPGSYWLYEFVIERDTDGVSVRFSQRGGWDFSALVDGERRTPPEGADGGISFEIGDQTSVVNVVGINKSLCVQIDKRLSSSAGAGSKKDILFFGTSSYLGLTPDKFNWNGPAIVRLGLTNADGELRLDGFVSGCNVFIHEVVPKALYDAGVRPGKMSVYRLDGSLWYDTDLPEAHEITQAEIDQLLADPKYTEAGHALIRGHLHVGDWIFATSSYFYDRQGVMRVEITNDNHRKGRLCLSKKIWAGVPGSDANGYSDPADTIQYAFGVVPAGTHYGDISNPDNSVDTSKLIGGVLLVEGANEVELPLNTGKYLLYEFLIGRDPDGVSPKFHFRDGWDFTAFINGEVVAPAEGEDGAVRFEIGSSTTIARVAAINKSLSVAISKYVNSDTSKTAGAMFFGTSSYLGLTQTDAENFDGMAVVRLGVTDSNGKLRLDGFRSGCNVFIHELVRKADYDAGIRPETMDVYQPDGSFWFNAGFPDAHAVTREELDALLQNPKFPPAARELIQANVHVGDWLFTNQNYFYQRQGVMRVDVLNNKGNSR